MIDNKIVSSIIESIYSNHESHDEKNLCDMCKIKRVLWNNESLRNLVLCMSNTLQREMVLGEFIVLESIIVGFILGKAYTETIELNRIIK